MNKQQIKQNAIDKLVSKYDLTYKKASVWVNKYYDAVINELRTAMPLMDKNQLKLGYFPINVEQLRKQIRFTNKGVLTDIIEDTDILTVITLGSNLTGKRTLMKTQIPLTELLKEEAAEETFKRIYKDHTDALADETLYEKVVIDMESLQNYYNRTRVRLAEAEIYGRDTVKIVSYLRIAKDLLQIQSLLGFVPHIINKSMFGRTYYKALNLQNAPTVIREAALGKCTNIDVSNSVFQWRADTVKEISPSTKIPFTLEYLDQKQYHRKRLVDVVFGDNDRMDKKYKMKLIKQAITAIGFGAKATDTSFWGAPALRNVFTPLGSTVVQKESLERFMNDPFMSSFIAEQEMIGNTIYKYFKESFKGTKNLECVSSKRGIEKTKVLAWLYQQGETEIMKPLYEILGDKVVLKVHDGFYATGLTKDDKLNYKQYFYESDITYDVKEVDPWKKLKGSVETAIELTTDNSDRERQHRIFRANEEKRAVVYAAAQIMKQKRAALKNNNLC